MSHFPFHGAVAGEHDRQCDGLVDVMSYWAFSDVFEEQGVVKRPFYGGFGLMAAGNIPKAAYNAFALLHHLGTLRLEARSNAAIITKEADGALAIAVWNYAPPGETQESGPARNFTLSFKGFPRALRPGSPSSIATTDPRSPRGRQWASPISRCRISRNSSGRRATCRPLSSGICKGRTRDWNSRSRRHALALVEIERP